VQEILSLTTSMVAFLPRKKALFNFNIFNSNNSMSQKFADLFESSQHNQKLYPGALIKATIKRIEKDRVVIDGGLKSEAVLPLQQFLDLNGNITVSVGDIVDVAVERLEDGFGETILSREKARRLETWIKLAEACESKETLTGMVTGRIKGGLNVQYEDITAFLPGSLVDVRAVRDTNHLEGKPIEFKVIKVDQKSNNVVVSRRAVLEEHGQVDKEAMLSQIEEGQELKGVVKNLTDYGAFVDLGGVDGLLHITDISWKRVKHPSEVLNIGDELLVKVLKYDRDKNRVSLGLKQLGDDPWSDLGEKYAVGNKIMGKVTTITDYGAFIDIGNGFEGLVHMSEMDWTNKNANPGKIVSQGQSIEVMILDVDPARRRFSLGLKQCQNNPWTNFAEKYQVGDKVATNIKSITDFGIFVGLENNIDGLIHLSDLSWEKSPEEAVRDYKKGDAIEAVILSIDIERERISLGVKQLSPNHFEEYLEKHSKNSVVSGTVTAMDDKELTVALAEGITGKIRLSDAASEKLFDLQSAFTVGQNITAKILNADKKNNVVNLSIKAKEQMDQKTALKELKQSGAPGATLGDLFKEQMDKGE
jgi:small subunit ribosomal protein S1